jgi:hypothetical protein
MGDIIRCPYLAQSNQRVLHNNPVVDIPYNIKILNQKPKFRGSVEVPFIAKRLGNNSRGSFCCRPVFPGHNIWNSAD